MNFQYTPKTLEKVLIEAHKKCDNNVFTRSKMLLILHILLKQIYYDNDRIFILYLLRLILFI